jgi:hypothetical protein
VNQELVVATCLFGPLGGVNVAGHRPSLGRRDMLEALSLTHLP